jgi:hypothetical protein
MGRPQAPLDAEAAEQALDYLRRALARKADVFSRPLPSAAAAYIDLLRRLKTTKTGDHSRAVNAWLEANVSHQGRSTMLAALRRRRADAAGAGRSSKTLRVSDRTYGDIVRLADKVGTPMATALDSAVQVALVDKRVQTMMVRLEIARSMTRSRAKRSSSK